MDAVDNKCSEMLLKLAEIYTAMTPEGNIKGMNIMEEKLKLERSFSEEYRELYCQLHKSISDLVWYIRQQSIPNDKNRTKKKQNKKK